MIISSLTIGTNRDMIRNQENWKLGRKTWTKRNRTEYQNKSPRLWQIWKLMCIY